MSPPPDAPTGRPRTFTRPPISRDDFDGRLTNVEHATENQQETNARILDELRTQSSSLVKLEKQVDRFLVQREEELKAEALRRQEEKDTEDKKQKRADRWKAAVVSLLGGIALALATWIAHIAMVVQTARFPHP